MRSFRRGPFPSLAYASFAAPLAVVVVTAAACHDEAPPRVPDTPPATHSVAVAPRERASSRGSERRSPAPSPSAAAARAAALLLTPPPSCAEGGYHVYPPFLTTARPHAAVFCLFQRPAPACGEPRMLLWRPDPLDQRPCLRFEPATRRFTLLRDWQRAPDRYPHVAAMDPLTICRAPGRCRRYPLRGLRSAALDPQGTRVAVQYESPRSGRARRERRVDLYQLEPWRRLSTLRIAGAPVRLQLLGRDVLAWVEHRGYASGLTHLIDGTTGRELRVFGTDALQPSFDSLLSPLVQVDGARWAAVDGYGRQVAIQDVDSGALRSVELDAYYRPLGRTGARARTTAPGQARLLGLGGGRLAVLFGDPVIGVAVIDGHVAAVIDVAYAPCS